MKNFTNNFKQFTSRLSARWLIMALMMLVGTSSAWGATIYVAGTMTNWNTGAKAMSGSGTVSVEFQLTGGTYEYRIVDDQQKDGTKPNNWHWVKTSPSSSSGVTSISNFTSVSSNNVSFTLASSASKYTVVIYYNTSTYTTYVKATLPATTYTISYDANGGTGAPANQTKIEGKDLTLSSTVPTRTGYIFTGWNTAANGSGTEYASGDSYTANAAATLYAQWCAPSATLSTANYDAVNNEIDLSGSIVTCGKELFYGFLWKNKEDANWNTANAISGTGGNNNKTKENKEFAHSWNGFTPGTTYEFTAYALDATTNPYTWYYSTNENDVIEVSTCTSIPDNAYAIAGNNEWTGNANPVTINYDANTYGTPTILYDDEAQIPTDVGTYAITINVPAHNGYCASTISLGDYEITCIDVERPDVTASATICEGQVTLSDYNGNNTNTVKWYSNSACTAEVTQPVTPTDDTKYYAKAYHEASGCYSSQYSTLTFKVNPLPTISIGDNTTAVKFEDVKLTATGNNIADVTWIADKGNIIEDAIDPKKAVLTYDQADAVTVTATATSAAGCTSVAATKIVTFGAEDCNGTTTTRTERDTDKMQILCREDGSTAKSNLKCYAFDKNKKEIFGNWDNAKTTNTTTQIGGNTYRVWTINNISTSYTLPITVIFYYKDNNNTYQTNDLATGETGFAYKYWYKAANKDDKSKNGAQEGQGSEITKTTTTTIPATITAPAVKIESVTTTTGLGNINFTGRVVKKGCDDTNEYGFQYSTDRQNWTTVKVGENASAGTPFSDNSVKGLDGTYYIRAYITNDHSTQTSAEKEIRLQTSTDPISNVSIEFVAAPGENNVPSTYCVGSTAYIKATYDGAKYTQFEWKSDQGITLTELGSIPNVFQFTVKGNDNIVLMLRNIYNREGEFFSNEQPLVVNATPEPIAPTISLDKSTLCSNDNEGATISLANTVVGQTYSLFKEIENGDDTQIGNDIECTEQNKESISFNLKGLDVAGRYYVIAKENVCNRTIGTTSVTLEVVNTTGLSISIEPNTAVVTPWEPVKLKITATEGYQYNVTGLDGMVYTVNGDTYTVKIPLPEGDTSLDTDGNVIFEGIDYEISATLITGGDNQCILPATCTITLTPYLEPCTQN